MWSNRVQRAGSDTTNPTTLTLRELMATQPRHVRGRLLPGERYPTGMRPGRRRAQGMDLDSVGPYVPGDDIRWMDWRATARTGRAQMKRFVAESHLARMLIVDFRAHLLFGTETRPMAKTAALLAAHMAWEGFVLQEPVGMVIVPDQVLVRPRPGRPRHDARTATAPQRNFPPGASAGTGHDSALDADEPALGPA